MSYQPEPATGPLHRCTRRVRSTVYRSPSCACSTHQLNRWRSHTATGLLPEDTRGHIILVFGGFTLFNLLINIGPNATTFTLPCELFPTSLRASAHGLAAAR
jgi:hypothetical protein